jgi:phosphohistidine phosphatase
MRLYLVQHGKALPKDIDPDRPLSTEGRAETERAAELLERLGLAVDTVWHSGKRRAAQTADILAAAIKTSQPVVQHQGLSPNDDVAAVANELNAAGGDIMIAGHLPFLPKLASLLLCGDELASVIAFRNSGVVCLSRNEDYRWQVEWVVTPEVLT